MIIAKFFMPGNLTVFESLRVCSWRNRIDVVYDPALTAHRHVDKLLINPITYTHDTPTVHI